MFSSTKVFMATKPPYGKLYAWGHDGDGALGLGEDSPIGSPARQLTPARVGSDDWLDIGAGWSHSMAIRRDGKLFAWGDNVSWQFGAFQIGIVPIDDIVTGSNSPLQIGNESWSRVACGEGHTLAIRADGSLFAWGMNNYGQIGDGTAEGNRQPFMVRQGIVGFEMEAVAAGQWHSLASRWSSFKAWGKSGNGQLGIGAIPEYVGTPRLQATPEDVHFVSNPKVIAAGGENSAAIDSSGYLYVWGLNNFGQVGDGTWMGENAAKYSPVKIGNEKWKAVSCGTNFFTAAIRADGKLFSWGQRQYPFGAGSAEMVPKQIGNDNWSSVSCGWDHALAIREDGLLFAWGYNSDGQLGDGTTVNKDITDGAMPVQIGTGRWKKVCCGNHFSLGIRDE